MVAVSVRPGLLVEDSCNNIINTVRSMPLNYSILETTFSIYLTVRKSLVKSAPGSVNSETKDEKVKMQADLEESVIESEEKSYILIT